MNEQNSHGGGWNKGVAVGPRRAFALTETKQISVSLLRDHNFHDLCLFSLGLDSMLRASDLLKLKVGDVIYPNGQVRMQLALKQKKTRHNVFPALTPETRRALKRWLEVSGKAPQHFLFTRSKKIEALPISRGRYAELVKEWATWVGQHPLEFSTHSIRRTKPRHMYQQGEDIALISRLLGHKSIAVTLDYLQIEQDEADAATLRHVMI